ncbi:histidine kinase [Actinomadura sp. DC4]|uniref:sensor histidine kinase n=1 Tax=Actinomadura sp. DC4 TaxID=3055069 RepID=UPI0025B23CD5|nr:histidine kinase [Actinomadura sp. DC4]MDN3356691.1 histidine kinase [Actinomadura sp. DC4]
MARHLLAAAVIAAETALYAAGGSPPVWGVVAYASVVTLAVALGFRYPVAAFALTVALAVPVGGAYVLLLWTAYQAGRQVVSARGTAIVAGAATGGLGILLLARPGDTRAVPNLVCAYVVFVGLPLLVGRYLAQHRRLLSALDRHNRRLLSERDLLAERERLRERLRIARDMHDSLGRRLSLVSIQAAALEVSVPAEQRVAVRRLATAAGGALDELHDVVGELRGRTPGVEAIEEVVGEFRSAGVPVTLRRAGEPQPVTAAAGETAYRAVEEGLTNAARHASGGDVTVSVGWEPETLLIGVVNRVPHASGTRPASAGHGLAGLEERVRAAGGRLEHGPGEGEYRLAVTLPVTPAEDDLPEAIGIRTAALGFATAVLMFVVLPAGMLVGVG